MLPASSNIPDLEGNIEGLRRHSFACLFVEEPGTTQGDRKLRSWLVHTVASASRHYLKARELVKRQESGDKSKDGGVIFHVLEVSEELEDCVMAAYRACMAIRRMRCCAASDFSLKFEKAIGELRAIRNQFDHMHSQITAFQTGDGPIAIVFGGEGRVVSFRRSRMDTQALRHLFDGAYEVVASIYPAFNASSKRELGGPIAMSATVSIRVIEGDGTERLIE